MTWSEYLIRLFAFKRMRKHERYMTREVMWTTLHAPHFNPKKLPKTKEQFYPIDGDTSTVTDKMKERMREVADIYLKQKSNGK